MSDQLHRFLFERYPIRGQLVRLDASWRALLEHRDYPLAIRDTLGEAMAAAVLLSSTLKFDGTLSLQLSGQGPMHLMLAQCSSALGVRGVARHQPAEDYPRDIAGLSGDGTLTVTLETEDLSQRYQGIVALEGEHLADCLRGYFESSEQLPTRLWLAADGESAAGLLLQRLPETAQGDSALQPQLDVDDAWQRAQLLADTLQPHELQQLEPQQLLGRVFAEDDLRLFEPAPVFFKCRCSRERVEGMLRALGGDEVRSVLAEKGQVEVNCDFCNRAYRFDPVDVERVLADNVVDGDSAQRH